MDDQFNNWVGQWEKALKDGVFNSEEEKSLEIDVPKNSKESFFGNLEINTEFNPSKEDIEYWNDVNKYTESEVVLNESKKQNSNKKRKERIEKVSQSANPVGIDTIGKDSNKFSKNLILNKDVEKLAEIKKKIYEIESEILNKEALGKDYSKAEKALEKIRKLMDEISDSISPKKLDSSTES